MFDQMPPPLSVPRLAQAARLDSEECEVYERALRAIPEEAGIDREQHAALVAREVVRLRRGRLDDASIRRVTSS